MTSLQGQVVEARTGRPWKRGFKCSHGRTAPFVADTMRRMMEVAEAFGVRLHWFKICRGAAVRRFYLPPLQLLPARPAEQHPAGTVLPSARQVGEGLDRHAAGCGRSDRNPGV